MQIVELELENLNLYSPSTGEVICDQESGYNDDARSLMGYWVGEIMNDPTISHPNLKKAWEEFCETYEEESDEVPDPDALDQFLAEYDVSDWIVFKINTFGIIGDCAWFVIDMEAGSAD